jgi:hypothetical protein
MYRYALVDGERREVAKGLHGVCEVCGRKVIAKCGSFRIWHWAHVPGCDCPANWWEPPTPWHLSWQSAAREEFREVCRYPHKADMVGDNDVVIEVQHSPISRAEIEERERFYGGMIWLFDATNRFTGCRSGHRFLFSFGATRHITACKAEVFLDFGPFLVQVESFADFADRSYGFSGFGLIRERE